MPEELAIPDLPQELVALREGWIPTWILFTNSIVDQAMLKEESEIDFAIAYQAAFPTESLNERSMHAMGKRLMNHPEVSRFLSAFFLWLNQIRWRGKFLQFAEKREILAARARGASEDVVDASTGRIKAKYRHLVDKVKVTQRLDPEGQVIETRIEEETMSAAEALKIDNKMEGHELAKPLDVNLNVTQQPRTEEEAQAEFLKCLESPLFREAILELPGVRERLALPCGED